MAEDTKTPNFGAVRTTAPATKPRGPGRPKGTPNKPKTETAPVTNAEVDQAMQVMEQIYDMTGLGLMMGQLPMTALHFTEQREQTKDANEKAFRASPKLCRQVAKMGSTGGAGAFVVANAMLAFGVYNTAMQELAHKRAERARAEQENVRTQAAYE